MIETILVSTGFKRIMLDFLFGYMESHYDYIYTLNGIHFLLKIISFLNFVETLNFRADSKPRAVNWSSCPKTTPKTFPDGIKLIIVISTQLTIAFNQLV